MTGSAGDVDAAREAFARGSWDAARELFTQVGEADLSTSDLDLFSRTSWLLGDVPGSMARAERAYREYAAQGQPQHAADLALRLALEWATRGDPAIAEGWLSRARGCLAEAPSTRASGYLTYLEASIALDIEGDPAPAARAAARVTALAESVDDPALPCFARVLSGMAAIRDGRVADGFAALDEAMLPVIAGALDPLWAGDIYCSVIHLCEGLGDLTRMRTWTEALDQWARPVSGLFMYTHVTRAHQLQLHSALGDWDLVEAELGATSERLAAAHGWVAGAGYVELGDVRRLRGDAEGAEQAYAAAARLGVDPQPGAALLLRDRGRTPDAVAALRVAIGERDRLGRARLVLPAVELLLELGDEQSAAALARDLHDTAGFFRSAGLRAWSARAGAALEVVQGRPDEALKHLSEAAEIYRAQRFRYALARVHEGMADALRGLGDIRAAVAEEATALAIYQRLGARPDVARLTGPVLTGPARAGPVSSGGLTVRELEVLACVAAGATNRQVAGQLSISDKTVSRHLANVYVKLGVCSRTAAAAWAHQHGLGR